MASVGTILIIGYVIVLTALLAWARQEGRVRAAHRRRSAILAKLREEPDTQAPIVGWIIRDDAAPAKRPRRGANDG